MPPAAITGRPARTTRSTTADVGSVAGSRPGPPRSRGRARRRRPASRGSRRAADRPPSALAGGCVRRRPRCRRSAGRPSRRPRRWRRPRREGRRPEHHAVRPGLEQGLAWSIVLRPPLACTRTPSAAIARTTRGCAPHRRRRGPGRPRAPTCSGVRDGGGERVAPNGSRAPDRRANTSEPSAGDVDRRDHLEAHRRNPIGPRAGIMDAWRCPSSRSTPCSSPARRWASACSSPAIWPRWTTCPRRQFVVVAIRKDRRWAAPTRPIGSASRSRSRTHDRDEDGSHLRISGRDRSP